MQKATTKVQKKKKSKTLVPRRKEGKMDQEKTCVFKRKMKKTN